MQKNPLDGYDRMKADLNSVRAVLIMLRCLASCTAAHGETGIHMLASLDDGSIAWLLKDTTERLDRSTPKTRLS